MAIVNIRGKVVGMVLAVAASGIACGGGSVEEPSDDSLPSFDQLKLEISGGYGPAPCSYGKDSYLVKAIGELTWTSCDYGKTPAESVRGDRTMSRAELDSVDSAFEKIVLSTAKGCGADFPVLTLDVTTPSGAVHLYADDFYSSCPGDIHVGRTFVTGLVELEKVLAQISKQ